MIDAQAEKKVLVDSCIFDNAIEMVPATAKKKVEWGDNVFTIDIRGMKRRQKLPPSQEWKQRQIDSIPSIVRAVNEGFLGFYRYCEIGVEAMKRKGGTFGNSVTNHLMNVDFKKVAPAIERTKFRQTAYLKKYVAREEVVDFCKFLLTSPVEKAVDQPELENYFSDFELSNIKSLYRFRELCSGLAEKQYPDAFHLWTAEVNGLDYFLTTDRKFIRVMTETKRTELPCRPVAPTTLLKVLHLPVRETSLHRLDKFFKVFGEPEGEADG